MEQAVPFGYQLENQFNKLSIQEQQRADMKLSPIDFNIMMQGDNAYKPT